MDRNEADAPEKDICSRCGVYVTPKNNRCPRCGSPMRMHSKRVPILIGIAGLLALLFVVGLMVVVMQHAEDDAATTVQTPK